MTSSQEAINAEVNLNIVYIKDKLKEIGDKLDNKYVTHEEFAPYKNIMYGLVSVILLSVLGAVLNVVISK